MEMSGGMAMDMESGEMHIVGNNSSFGSPFDDADPVFVKRKEYSNQQEYRLYVQHSISIENDEKMKNQNGAFFKKSTVDKTFEFNIGQIDGYSMIFSLKEFIDHSILIDYKHQFFLFLNNKEMRKNIYLNLL